MQLLLRAICSVTLIALVIGQRGAPSCTLPAKSCFHSLNPADHTAKSWDMNQDIIEWTPSRPGAYTFEYEVFDLCNSMKQPVTVNARCPPKPTARVTTSMAADMIVYQGGKAELNASASSANFPDGSIKTYEFYIMSAPAESPLYPNACDTLGRGQTCDPVSRTQTYATPSLQISGEYRVKIVVSDGCSEDESLVCFTVQCGCGPTANAGATSTIWTNTPAGFNNGQTSSGSNVVDLGSPQFMLDGTLSYDFDTKSGLTYDWSFQEWVQIQEGGTQLVWTPTTNTQSGGRGGMTLKTTCTEPRKTTSTYQQECSFDGIPSAAGAVVTPGRVEERDNSPAPSGVITPSGFPKKCPDYVATEYDWAVPTTQMKAEITRTVQTNTTVTCFTQRTTTVAASEVKATNYCKIRITQTANNNVDARQNAVAMLSVSSLQGCRGLWTYRLTVTDGCGSSTASTDDIKVTVRCNEPPVAVACCNNTQMWDTQIRAFQEVRIDGRGSNDKDNMGSLTYTWSFINSPVGYCPYAHKPCVEPYCSNANGFTSFTQTSSFAPTFEMNFGGSPGIECGPTVFPIIYDRTRQFPTGCTPPSTNGIPSSCTGNACRTCQYEAIAPTNYHVGNSAYFFPDKRGEYHVQLTVSDGCSESTDRIYIFAECPLLTVTARAVDSRGASPSYNLIKPGSGPVSIDAEGPFTYAAETTLLSFAWKATSASTTNSSTASGVTFTAGNSQKTTVQFNAAGQYIISFDVTDQCQTVSASLPTITVNCNPAPTGVTVSRVSADSRAAGNVVVFDGTRFPPVTLQVQAQDQDALTYQFTLTQSLASISGTNPSPTQFEFTPATGNFGTQSYVVTATANDGCQSSPSGQFRIEAQCGSPLQSVPRVTGRSATVVDYDPAAPNPNFFPQVTIESQSQFPSYPNEPVRSYNWAVTRGGRGSTGGAVTFQGQSTQTISLRPETDGQYTVQLTISDGCGNATSSTTFTAQCATTSVAMITSTSGTAVSWNSYMTANSGAFPAVTLDGSTSTGYAGQELRYAWGVATGNPAKIALTSTSGATTSFTPTIGGNYGFTLSVRNGPCPESAVANYQISANCNELSANLRQVPGSANAASISVPSAWDGTKFAVIELDGTGLVYRETGSRDPSAQSGNLRSLKYTWTVESSPACSCYMQDKGSVSVDTKESESDPVVTDVPSANATVSISSSEYCKTTTTTTTTTITTLANHHYTLPHTCFKPDCPGQYRIQLKIEDGCTEATATATVSAACAPAPQVTIESPGTQTLEGNKFKRVDLRANVVFPASEHLTYQWTLDKIPDGSRLKAGGYLSITNAQMPQASIVPDRAGTYQFSFRVNDGCNEAQTATMSMTVQCNSNLQIESAVSTPVNIDWVGRANEANGINNFDNKMFKLTGSTDRTKCNVLSTRWTRVSRGCSDPYPPGATKPPVPVVEAGCSRCEYTCKWDLLEQPCNDLKVNPKYKPPTLTGGTLADKCVAKFKPEHPGTYTLQFSVDDCCGRSVDTAIVVAKCATGIKASVDAQTIDSSLTCTEWEPRTLRGVPETLRDAGPPNAVHSCPVQAADPCTQAVKDACCPKTTTKCCNYKCPQCAQCPQCPQCPGYTAASAGSAEYKLPYNTAFTASTESSSNPFIMKASLLTGIVAPLGGMIVFSLVGNIVLVSMYRSKQSEIPY